MVTASILVAFVVITLSIAYYAYRNCFYSPKDREEDPYSRLEGTQYAEADALIRRCTAIMENTPFRWIHIRSFDHTDLHGRYYHNADNAPLLILFHGYRSCALRDCAGGFALAKKLRLNVLAVDQRSHGKSGGTAITFGVLERYDCLYWANFAAKHICPGTPILLSGLSMGAATVLMAAELPLPENVVCILADCPYSSPSEIILKVCKDRGIPAKLTYPFILLAARLFARFSLNAASAAAAVQKATVPIILYHGEDDRFVPCQMSRDIYAACHEGCQLHTFQGAGHGLSYITDPVRYEQVTYDFLRQIPALSPWLSVI